MDTEKENVLREPRTVIVTGGSRGIGLAAAKQFQLLGDKVVITYHSTEPSQIDTTPPNGMEGLYDLKALRCDITSTQDIENLFTQTEAEFGTCDVLVLAAGINDDSLLIRMSEEKWSNVIDANLTSCYKATKRALPAMLKKRSGRIILISSAVAMTGNPGQTNYAATKAAMIGFGRSLAREVASRSITVNIITPGLVDTDMLSALTKEQLEVLSSKVPMSRVGTKEEIAAAICFLASDEASYITGSVLAVDGGLGMGH
ncbi:MAG: 3-oxoacyl-ACP reductase FabG [Firmicutes bacterium]|nr:3-oxoacyl-ACP reductase FabG [Bacillota bacterium]